MGAGRGCTHGCSHSGAVERATGVAGQRPEPGGWRRGVGNVGPPQPSGHRWWRAPLFPCGPLVCVPSTDGNKIVLLFITLVGFFMLFYLRKRLAGHPQPPPIPLGKRQLQGGQRRMAAGQVPAWADWVFFFPSRTAAGSPEPHLSPSPHPVGGQGLLQQRQDKRSQAEPSLSTSPVHAFLLWGPGG